MAIIRDNNSRVGFAELFFDLVFVFAITQVSHLLLHHYSLIGALEVALLFLAIWWVWIYTTWVLNMLDPDSTPVRGLLFALMGLGLFLSMSIPESFGDRGLIFAAAYVAMQLGRSLFMLAIVWAEPLRRQTYLRITAYFILSSGVWIFGGLVHDHGLRLAIWAVALGIDYMGPVLSYRLPGLGRETSTNWKVSGAHMAERCGLFVIICLGETLLVSGATFAKEVWTGIGIASFLSAFLGTVAMWWVYFHIGHRRGAHQIEHSENAGAVARLAFTYFHIPIVAGVVLAAVGAEKAIAHPMDPAGLGAGLSVVGGVALFLLGNGLFKQSSAPHFPLSHLVGMVLCLALFLAGPLTSLLVQAAASTAVLVLVAVWENLSLKGGEAASHPA